MKAYILSLMSILLLCPCLAAKAVRLPDLQVRGNLIDVRSVGGDETVFPQNNDYRFDDSLKRQLKEGTRYACSLAEYRGPEQFRLARRGSCRIALDSERIGDAKWKPTGEVFDLGGGLEYHVFERRRCKAGEWIDIPYPGNCRHTALIFGAGITVADTPDFGTVICKVSELRTKNAYNQTMTILPDGNYLACCSLGMPGDPQMFISRDKGATWQPHGNYDSRKNKVGNYFNLFVHRGSVYLMGIDRERSGLFISRSDDGGLTWTTPEDSHSGMLLEGIYHTAPVPVCVADGRIWRGCETHDGKNYGKPFLMSAPEDADLLEASSWKCTNTVPSERRKVGAYSLTGSLIEGNAVALREGGVVNLIRTNSTTTSKYATILHAIGADSLSYDPVEDLVEMPGGGKKFTCRYDPVSDLYWALTNPDAEMTVSHEGIYKKGMSHSLMRNRLALVCSKNLRDWIVADDSVLYHADYFFHGFQYADWLFDGDDIVAVVRVAAPESRGLPSRQHDSNMMSFIRISGFRNKIDINRSRYRFKQMDEALNDIENMRNKWETLPLSPATDIKMLEEQIAANPTQWDAVLEFLQGNNLKDLPLGRHEITPGGVFANVQEYNTRPSGKFEAHKKYIDIQIVVEGNETIWVAPVSSAEFMTDEYNEENDIMFWSRAVGEQAVSANPASWVVLFPSDAHKPCISCGETPMHVRKIVVKIPYADK